jgi:hypothetical protein
LEWNPQGQGKRGRRKRSWERKIREEALTVGKTWGEIKQLSKNRVRWRHLVNILCSSGSKRTMMIMMMMIPTLYLSLHSQNWLQLTIPFRLHPETLTAVSWVICDYLELMWKPLNMEVWILAVFTYDNNLMSLNS